ncbi:hypothetical protein CW745_14620 [Psychromonas sp. psych-6C06]|uniref:hypothetical protein n=1 Tax=Psychromonas sp. psych-6C06 TaxID=2058089 RepID=UPI000C321D49|nr:hypothetical protein [Psychromonas sp. psych-6C06]PKF60569.1 hypothetical protein CW745_14620 [Psychromonas sp. psych-6C06]
MAGHLLERGNFDDAMDLKADAHNQCNMRTENLISGPRYSNSSLEADAHAVVNFYRLNITTVM